VRKVFEVETLGLDFGLRLTSESKSPAWAGLKFFFGLSLSAVSMVSMSDLAISHVTGE
jgi:hypothetical protein